MSVERVYSEVQAQQFEACIAQNTLLVKRIALHLVSRLPPSVQLEDLIQAGMIGLIEAAQKYDQSKGASFETYAGIRIRGAMIDEIRKGDWVPRSVHRNTRKVMETIQKIEKQKNGEAKDTEVAKALGMEIEEYYSLLQDMQGSFLFSYDELTSEREKPLEFKNLDTLEPCQGLEKQALLENIADEIDKLPEREKLVLALYYDEELNLKEIGEVLGISESRVCQIHSQAALRLRSRLTHWHL